MGLAAERNSRNGNRLSGVFEMARRVVIGAVLAAILTFVWGFLFWALSGIPAKTGMMQPLPGDEDGSAGTVFTAMDLQTGVYVYPWFPEPDAEEVALEAFKARHRQGPILQLFYNANGWEPMTPIDLAKGWLHFFVIALMAGTLLAMAAPALTCYWRRFCFVLLIALLVAVWVNGAGAVWHGHPLAYCLGTGFFQIVCGLLMALPLAALIKPCDAAASCER